MKMRKRVKQFIVLWIFSLFMIIIVGLLIAPPIVRWMTGDYETSDEILYLAAICVSTFFIVPLIIWGIISIIVNWKDPNE